MFILKSCGEKDGNIRNIKERGHRPNNGFVIFQVVNNYNFDNYTLNYGS